MKLELTEEQIKTINESSPMEWQENEQGIFTQPAGIPVNVKSPVVYMRWHTGGYSGGSCWDDSNPQPYNSGNAQPRFAALDLVLKELCPDITYLQFREIEGLIKHSDYNEIEYYGNCINFDIRYLLVSDLLEFLNTIKQS